MQEKLAVCTADSPERGSDTIVGRSRSDYDGDEIWIAERQYGSRYEIRKNSDK